MMKKSLIIVFLFFFVFGSSFAQDYRTKEIKYRYKVLKEDAQYNRDKNLLNREPTGYMTVEEYEKQSEYKDKSTLNFEIPKHEVSSEFKYIPKPVYKIVKYNDPPGSPELSLGRKLFVNRQINAQGVVSPDYTKLVYSAVYYYNDSGSTASDLFVIPLNGDDAPLNKILKANVAKRNPEPILSTDKTIDDYMAFRSLTPVDFSQDGTKLLVKEKLGTGEDGIWATKLYVYDFSNEMYYDLNAIRDAISYYWTEYKNLNLIEKRWDIVPLGFDVSNPTRIVVRAYAYTGSAPVYLGAWSIDIYGKQSRLISFDKDYSLNVSSNGYKVIQDGVEAYQTVKKEEKAQKRADKFAKKEHNAQDKKVVKKIKEDYKYELKTLKADYKEEYKDNKKLQSLKGSTETNEIKEAFSDYKEKQIQKDIEKTQKIIDKQQKKIDKIENKIQKITNQTKELMEEESSGNVESLENKESNENVDTEQ